MSGSTCRGSKYFASFHRRGQLLKERICSSRSKFFPFRVDFMLKSYLIHRSKLIYHCFLEKSQGMFIRAGHLLGFIPYLQTERLKSGAYIFSHCSPSDLSVNPCRPFVMSLRGVTLYGNSQGSDQTAQMSRRV